MKNHLHSVPPEVRWAVGVGTAFHFPVLWAILFPVALWRLVTRLSLLLTLWLQTKRGPTIIEINGRRFAGWTHRDGTHSVNEV